MAYMASWIADTLHRLPIYISLSFRKVACTLGGGPVLAGYLSVVIPAIIIGFTKVATLALTD